MTNLFTRNLKKEPLKPINEVANELNVEPYVLRFWETKFMQIIPTKGKGNRRLYSGNDIYNIKKIKDLLYNKGYTIEGAKKFLNDNKEIKAVDKNERINKAILELTDIKNKLEALL
jgi:DNA-binding transcriptional MerR regulator